MYPPSRAGNNARGIVGAQRLLTSNEREEHVEGNLDTIDEHESVLRGDELEVNSVDEGPDPPGSLAGREEVVLDLVSDSSERISIDQSQVGEENGHEDWTPYHLVKGNLHGYSLSFGSLDKVVEPVVEVVPGGSVVQETKGRKSDEALHVKWTSGDEDLQNIDEKAKWVRYSPPS